MKGYVECLLQVMGDAASLNTFDKLFRSGKAPRGRTALQTARRVTPCTRCSRCRRLFSAGDMKQRGICGAVILGRA